MKPLNTVSGFLFLTILAAPVVAQTQIGGGTCNSASLNGIYALSIAGRQVTAAGVFTNVFQANGSVTFDGLSTVTIAVTQSTNQVIGTSLTWSGTYSVQANCAATINVTSGGSATLNVMVYNQGKDFLLTGADATYSYNGSGVSQPSGCSAGTLNGVYTFNTTGYALTTNSVSGVANGSGLLQFDGQGNLSVNLSSTSGGSTSTSLSLTGSYAITSNCLGSATLSDSAAHSYVMSFSLYSVTTTNTNFYVTLAGASNFLMTGGGHTAYGQPAPSFIFSSVPATTITGGTCSTSNLNGTYSLVLNGRAISSLGIFNGSYQGVGTATFDGQGNVTLAGTVNTNLAQGKAFSYTGTYSVPSNCFGTLTITTSGAASFAVVVWSGGTQFDIVGSDATYVYSGSGSNTHPFCATATLSGGYSFTANGFTLSGTTQNGAQDEAGVFQFDGQGSVTATYTDTQSGTTPVSNTATGTYTVTSGCLGSATLKDSSGKSTALNFVMVGLHGENLDVTAASTQFVRTGTAHSVFVNPSQAITNVASYAYSATPPGSVFALFGQNLATRAAGAVTTTLPTKLLNTTVTVNGELAPLFYVDTTQIDAQMPWDIPGNTVASVIVTNGTSASNAAAVYVPASGTPGISEYLNDRAVVVNTNGSLNAASAPAAVGDEVVVYFTGGGPVQASGKLTTGAPAPSGLSPVTGDHSVTVGGVQASVVYMGLTPGSVGLYQANIIVPQIVKGTYPVIITISGQASNNPLMTVSN